MCSCLNCFITDVAKSEQMKVQQHDVSAQGGPSPPTGDVEQASDPNAPPSDRGRKGFPLHDRSSPQDVVPLANINEDEPLEPKRGVVDIDEDPFNQSYYLWEVTAERAKVRVFEHRKSKKICELSTGTVVRQVSASDKTRRFKIDYPLVGWCCSFEQHSSSRARQSDSFQPHGGQSSRLSKVFNRVDPRDLPVLDGRFVLELKVGQGSFGKVYVAWDTVEKRKVAIKVDQPKREKKSAFSREIEIMRVLKDCPGVPRLLWCASVTSHTRGRNKEKYGSRAHDASSYLGLQYMVIDLQGMSLSLLKKNYLKYFSLKTVLMLGIEIVNILKAVHEHGVLHRDIKPANFVISRENKGRGIYVLDFGLSVMYRKDDGSHATYRTGCRRCGTARYSSINTHQRVRQSRRDDLEAAGYVLLLFLKDLPWKQKKGETPEKKWTRILEEKQRWSPRDLVERQTSRKEAIPTSIGDLFERYFDYCKSLKYSEEPNYAFLVKLFTEALEEQDKTIDFMYDWVQLFLDP